MSDKVKEENYCWHCGSKLMDCLTGSGFPPQTFWYCPDQGCPRYGLLSVVSLKSPEDKKGGS